jgi:hypothetical protein
LLQGLAGTQSSPFRGDEYGGIQNQAHRVSSRPVGSEARDGR